MSDWLHNLPIFWMTFVVFGFTYLLAAGIYGLVMVLAKGERARAFKAISPGMLPPLGIIFGLFVAFTAAQVWADNERANTAVDREASALRAVVVLAGAFPGEPESRLRALIRRHIEEAATQEWPMMARGTATLRFTSPSLAEAVQLTLALTPNTEGQKTAQREIATALETAFDARRQRIIISQSQVNLVKWLCLFVAGCCRVIRDSHGPLRQSDRLCDRARPLCNGCGGVRIANRRPRPAIHGRDLSWAGAAPAGHAGG